ncbi:uncharacterized protein LOC122248966 [Penaeus japonicus]|uniref:uncharacterized protein LOC122248966 n=1 Tax=Penaeus japonicus TaxID=27405 RepID=UPI001C715B92|nr:uncharacterized protein LOC122248966 [Penaeus japonicus]
MVKWHNFDIRILAQGESNIETHEKGVAELRAEAARVERAAQELNGEVEEYVTETKAPLVEITNSLAELDIQRIRKLLDVFCISRDKTPEAVREDKGTAKSSSKGSKADSSSRSPISAIQVVFECAVSLLSNQDVTWRAVRHATQDEAFCTKVAAVCVPGLKQAQITSLTEKLEQIKMTPEHLSRVSDIGGILLQYLRTAIFFWHRYHEDVQPRQERVQELKDQCTQLQVEMATKERLIRGSREEVAKLTTRLKSEEGRVVALKRQKIDIEEELTNVVAVITELQPHAERWRKKINEQEDVLTQLTGKCLLEAARLTYLSGLPPSPRSALACVWEADLMSRGLLAPQQPQPQRGLRLVLRAGELQQDVDEALRHHANRAPLLLLRDPHHLVEEYVRGGVWVNVESGSWKESLVERLAVTPRTPLYLRLQHGPALEVVASTQKLLQDGDGGLRLLIVLDDMCSSVPCPLCAIRPIIDLALDDQGIVHQLVQTAVRWHDPQLEEEMVRTVQVATAARQGKEAAEGALVRSLIHASKATSADDLDAFMDHVDALNNAINTSGEQEEQLAKVTSRVSEGYLRMGVYAGLLHRVAETLAALDASYSLPLHLLHENLAYKMDALGEAVRAGDIEKEPSAPLPESESQSMLRAVTESVFELLDIRLQLRHRAIVAACFALARANLDHPDEDYVKAFLTGTEPASLVWEGVAKGAGRRTSAAGVDGEAHGEREEEREEEKEGEEEEEGDKDKEEKEESGSPEEEEESEPKEEMVDELEEEDETEEDCIPDWIPQQCGPKARRVLARLSIACPSLFPPPPGSLDAKDAAHLLLWLDKATPTWPNVFQCSGSLMQAAQQVVMARHLRPDLLAEAIVTLVGVTLGHGVLTPPPDVLSQAVTQHARARKTKKSGLSDVIQVSVGRGVDPARLMTEAARRTGLPFYKLTFLSLATASHQELRRRVVMAARRRTWLVLLDCEVAPHVLPCAHAALLALPRTLPTPAVLCVVADGSECARRLHCAVVAQIEHPIGLASTLASYLPVAHAHHESHAHSTGSSDSFAQAATLITAYAHSLLSVRGEYGRQGWHRQPMLPETLLVEALEAARHHSMSSSSTTPAWDVLAKLLSKVVYGSVLTSNLDQMVVDKLFSDHLNNHVFPAKTNFRHADSQQTDTATESTRQTSESRAETAELLQEEDEESRRAAMGREDVAPSVHPHQTRGGPSKVAILLHSFTEKDLSLDLELPPQLAVDCLSEDAQAREDALLGVHADGGKNKEQEQLMDTLGVFAEEPTVRVPAWAVLAMIAELRAALAGPVSIKAALVTREEDLETRAWQQEARIWDSTYEYGNGRLQLIQELVRSGSAHPSVALRILADLLRTCVLEPNVAASLAGVCAGEGEAQAGQGNRMRVEAARAVATATRCLCREWRARYQHLLTWAEHETPPTEVHLGLLAEPGWFLTRLRAAVCTRAHWPLHGSLVHARPVARSPAERPQQGVYVSGTRLVGGRWSGEEVVPGDCEGDGRPLILVLTVSHALPPTPVGCVWVPMVSRSPSASPLFPVLLPLHPAYESIRTPLHLVSL